MCDVLCMNIPIKFTTSWKPRMQYMASTNVCWLYSRSSVNLFTAIGLKNKWASRISALQVAVDDDQSGEVGVSLDTVRARPKASSLGGTFYPNVSKYHKIQLIFTESNNKLIHLL